MTIYEKELQMLKSHDEVQGTEKCSRTGLDFIYTAGHGYLVVPKSDKNIVVAEKICDYGYIGKEAIYLEEDCEAPEFIEQTK